MKYSVHATPAALKTASTAQLLDLWDMTENLQSAEAPTVRGWLMDEIASRSPSGFDAWLEQDDPQDRDLRRFILA